MKNKSNLIHNSYFSLLGLTIVGIQFHSITAIFTPSINRVLGIVLAGLMIWLWNRKSMILDIFNIEIILWIIFLLWSIATGVFVSVNSARFMSLTIFLIQFSILIVGMITLVIIDRELDRLVYIILLLPIVFILFLIINNQLYLIQYQLESESDKLGDIMNANSIGFLFFNGIVSITTLFYKYSRRKNKQYIVFSFVLIVIFTIIILQTGSRKNTLSLLLYFILLYLLLKFKKKNISLKFIAGILIFSIFVYLVYTYLFPIIIENTYFGYRFQNIFTGDDGSTNSRTIMIREGLKLFQLKPITGLGLDQFREYSATSLYAHNDYIEVLSDTGIVGFIVYMSIYLIMLCKLYIIRKRESKSSNDEQWLLVNFLIAGLVSQLVMNMGLVAFTSMSHWLRVTPIIAYLSLYRKIDEKKKIVH